MPTDATGTPTSLGIRKYNTSADAPSGLGFNGAMDDIDALLVARIPKTLLSAAGDIIYASGVSTPARLAVGATGNVLTVAGGLPSWAAPSSATELAYNEFTANVTATVVAEASAVSVIASSSVAYDGATPVVIEFFASQVSAATAAGSVTILSLWEDAVDLGWIGVIQQNVASTSALTVPVRAARRRTPSAASHTYTVKAHSTTAAGVVVAGAGGAGTNLPGYIRITKAA